MHFNPNQPRNRRGEWTDEGIELAADRLFPNHPSEAEIERGKETIGKSSATSKNKRTVIFPGDGSVEIRRDGSRAWRNNNPGNLVRGDFAKRHGAIGDDGEFAIFPNQTIGKAAQEALIKNRYGDFTLDDMIAKYAPPHENDTAGYQAYIRRKLGLPGNTVINTLTPDQLRGLGDAIRAKEGTKAGSSVVGRD